MDFESLKRIPEIVAGKLNDPGGLMAGERDALQACDVQQPVLRGLSDALVGEELRFQPGKKTALKVVQVFIAGEANDQVKFPEPLREVEEPHLRQPGYAASL